MTGNKTYVAEDTVWRGIKARKHREPMPTSEVRRILDRFGLEDWQIKRVTSSGGACRLQSRLITIGRLAPAWVTYHELGHALGVTHGHNPVFRAEYVRVVRAELGDYWAHRLETAFRRAGLQVGLMTSVTKGA